MTTIDNIFSDYLQSLKETATVLPEPQRTDLLTDIAEHLDAARANITTPGQAQTTLERLGDVQQLVATAMPTPKKSHASLEPTLFLYLPALLFIATAPTLLAYFPLGIAVIATGITLLAFSRLYNRNEKLFYSIITVIVPIAISLTALVITKRINSTEQPASPTSGGALGPLLPNSEMENIFIVVVMLLALSVTSFIAGIRLLIIAKRRIQ
ncbi:MAG: HAAS signaling domain-containing protein [Propionibacteriaceae bacterium]